MTGTMDDASDPQTTEHSSPTSHPRELEERPASDTSDGRETNTQSCWSRTKKKINVKLILTGLFAIIFLTTMVVLSIKGPQHTLIVMSVAVVIILAIFIFSGIIGRIRGGNSIDGGDRQVGSGSAGSGGDRDSPPPDYGSVTSVDYDPPPPYSQVAGSGGGRQVRKLSTLRRPRRQRSGRRRRSGGSSGTEESAGSRDPV